DAAPATRLRAPGRRGAAAGVPARLRRRRNGRAVLEPHPVFPPGGRRRGDLDHGDRLRRARRHGRDEDPRTPAARRRRRRRPARRADPRCAPRGAARQPADGAVHRRLRRRRLEAVKSMATAGASDGSFLRIRMLPALHGDCLWIEYGSGRRVRRVLVDGGPIGAWGALEAQVASMPAGDRRIELVVLTHVDTDHVDGLVRLFAEAPPWTFTVRDVWFNGWRHLEPAHGLLGGRQGEFFSALLARRLDGDRWNGAFGGGPVVVPDDGALPSVELPGGLVLTLLSPTPSKLERMRKAWKKDMRDFDAGDLEAAWQVLAGRRKYLPSDGLLGSTPELDALLEKQSR